MIAENKVPEMGLDCQQTDVPEAFASVQEAYFELAASHQQLERWVAELSHSHEANHASLAESEAARHRAELRVANLLHAIPAGVVILDPNGAVRDFNPVAAEMLGDLTRGTAWFKVVEASFSPRWDDGHDITLRSGRRVNLSTQALQGEPGQIVLLKDVTETRALQDELNRHRSLASMGEMAAALAHQVRTPLASAILYLSNLRLGRGNEALREKCIDHALSRLQHLERLVADMLLFARGGAFEASELSVSDLLHALVTEETLTDGFTVEIIDATGKARIRGNRDALTSALGNLIENARQACLGSGTMLIEAIANDVEGLTLRFTDDGPGVPDNLRETIFEPFFTTRMGGSGLGLAVTQAVVEAHGGDNNGTEGSTFVVRLPARIVAEASDDSAAHPGTPS